MSQYNCKQLTEAPGSVQGRIARSYESLPHARLQLGPGSEEPNHLSSHGHEVVNPALPTSTLHGPSPLPFLLAHLRGNVVVWDGGGSHKGPAVQDLLRRNGRLT